MDDSDKKNYLEFAKTLALEAGEIMRNYFLKTDVEWKQDDTPVTIADTTINRMVIERIATAFPDHSVLGEEESDMKDGALVWVCDPVDGTMPYSHGLPISTFSLALCDNGAPQVGVVYDPFMNRLFSAYVGGGSYCNDAKIQVNHNGIKNALIDPAAFEDKPFGIKRSVVEELHLRGAKTSRLWSSVLPACLVADGKYEATMFAVEKPEDPAAIKVIVEEAGGRVTDLFGNDQRYDQPTKGFVASNGVIHDELVQIIQEVSR